MRLVAAGRSKTAISLHNFDLAADVGIYRKRRYLRRGMIYNKMGEIANHTDRWRDMAKRGIEGIIKTGVVIARGDQLLMT